jgi:hypothetical protein
VQLRGEEYPIGMLNYRISRAKWDYGRNTVMNEIRRFELDTSPVSDHAGHTKEEFDRLVRPLPVTTIAAAGFAVKRYFMRMVGRLAEGIQVLD